MLAADHHGTSSIAMDTTTYAVTKRYSTPFGAPRGTKATNWPDDKAFLGKPADDSTGLTHVGAREYDPGIGQFISVDPVLSVDQHQSINGYSYAGNAPVTDSDPTGLCFADACGVGTPKGDGSGEIITDGPIDPQNPGGGSCHRGVCGPVQHNKTGTSHASSTGHTDSGPTYSCSGLPPVEICKPNTGPQDTESSGGNYLSSLFGNSDLWVGLAQLIGGGLWGGAPDSPSVEWGSSNVGRVSYARQAQASSPSAALWRSGVMGLESPELTRLGEHSVRRMEHRPQRVQVPNSSMIPKGGSMSLTTIVQVERD
ncbi:RHS repeat-associated core domain-containing protein [Streptomyces avermitilis]